MQTVIPKTLENTLYDRNIPVFIYKITYPFFTTTCNKVSAQKVNAYYAASASRTEQYCKTVLYPQAVESTRYRQSNVPPFFSYTLEVTFQITYNFRCITSLYTDTYTFMGGAHGETKRTSDTWDFNTGQKLLLNDFYPLTSSSMQELQKLIEGQISNRMASDPGSYFDNYPSLLRDSFNPQSYYIRPERGVIYYQQYDIAPYATGLPEFYFPLFHPPVD